MPLLSNDTLGKSVPIPTLEFEQNPVYKDAVVTLLIQNGTFAPGNKAAAGRSSRAAELRKAFVDAVSVEDIQAIAFALVKSAKDGDISAAKLVLDRLGKADPSGDEVASRDRETSISRLLEMARARQSELARASKDAVIP